MSLSTLPRSLFSSFLRSIVTLVSCLSLCVSGLCISGFAYSQEIINSDITYREFNFKIPATIDHIFSVDLNNDSHQDLLATHPDGLFIYLQKENGVFNFDVPDKTIDLSGTSLGWDIVEFNPQQSTQSKASLLALIDGKKIVTWDFTDLNQTASTIIDNLSGFPPRGAYHLNFAQDINDDGYTDFIIPGSGQLDLYLQQATGGFQERTQIQSTTYLETTLQNFQSLDINLGQRLYIPLMELKDVNSDGHNDLISRSEERLDVFIQQTQNDLQTFPPTPSYTLDIAEIEERLGEFSIDQLDFSNLTGVLALSHQIVMHDVDSDGIQDLLVREGGKISLFTGTSDGMDFSQPKQVLRSSGNVLAAMVRDEDGDGLDDLWLSRVEDISIGDAFLWLALSGNIEIDAFIYRNEGTQFARRPARKITLEVKLPSALRLMGMSNDLIEEVEGDSDMIAPQAFADINENTFDELVVLLNDRIDIYMDTRDHEDDIAISEEEIQDDLERTILAFFDYSADKDNYEIDVKDLIDKLIFNKNQNSDLIEGLEPQLQIALPSSTETGDVFPIKLNQDAIDDLVIFLERDDDYITAVLLLSN